jgi:outer membrane protein OmpA-like peptidoglycan-associated protein
LFVGSRLRMVPLLMSLLAGAGSLAGCHKDKAADKTNKAASADEEASIRQSLEGLKPRLSAQDAKFVALGKQVEALPSDLPGYGEVRAKFYATQEGRGIMGVKLTWLSERLDAALKSAKREDVDKVSKDVTKTYDEVAQIDQIHLELLHQLAQLERMAARRAKETSAGTSSIMRILPTNYEVRGNQDGIEQRLLELLEDSKRKVDKNSWFDFDHVAFVGAGAELDHALSKHQLENVSEILKAYPKVTLKIGGYTDNTGPADASKKLSAERAEAVKAELVRLGVAASRLDAKGFGAERPICAANDTEECRNKNRRVAVHITAK